jgi:hypothetical protein
MATKALPLASYLYDKAEKGLGLLAEVSWGAEPAAKEDRFAYDDRGRVTF